MSLFIAYIFIIAYLIWKGSYNTLFFRHLKSIIIAYLIWKGSYNAFEFLVIPLPTKIPINELALELAHFFFLRLNSIF